jgi:hypothetical protein
MAAAKRDSEKTQRLAAIEAVKIEEDAEQEKQMLEDLAPGQAIPERKECLICTFKMEPGSDRKECILLPCKHTDMCLACIRKWKGTCPVCRAPTSSVRSV